MLEFSTFLVFLSLHLVRTYAYLSIPCGASFHFDISTCLLSRISAYQANQRSTAFSDSLLSPFAFFLL